MLFNMSEANMTCSSEMSTSKTRPTYAKQNSMSRKTLGQSQREHYQQHTRGSAMLGSREARAKVRVPPWHGLPPARYQPRDASVTTHPLGGLTLPRSN